jgi:uncharacterized phage-associated protein
MLRTPEEEAVDRLLLLYLIDYAHKMRSLWGKTKLEKLVYCAQYSMSTEKTKGFNYFFYKWKFGPFSKEIYEDLEQMKENRLILTKEFQDLQPTPIGTKVIDDCKEIFKQNHDIINHIDCIVKEFKNYTADAIKDEIYGMVILGQKQKRVGDADLEEPLLQKLPLQEAKRVFQIDRSWLETLEIMFSGEFYESIIKARSDPRTVPYEPLT